MNKQLCLIILFLLMVCTYSQGQEICNNNIDDDGDGLVDCADCLDCAGAANCLLDTDNDGIGDYCDDDDDNDGITDDNENACGFFDDLDPNPAVNTHGLATTSTLTTKKGQTFIWTSSLPHEVGGSINYRSCGSVPSSTGTLFNVTVTFPTPTTTFQIFAFDFDGPGFEELKNFNVQPTNVSSNAILTTTGTGKVSSASRDQNITITWNLSSPVTTLTFDITRPQCVWGIQFLVGFPYCDNDNDGIVDSKDTDSDGDGCPDVIESGGVDANSDGYLDGTGFSSDGLVQNHVGGYNGLTGQEYNALGITEGTLNNLTVTSGNSASFHIGTTAQSATGYNNGTPVYGSPGNKNSGLSYQWYLGNPNAGGTLIVNGGIYSGATTATLNISSITGLNNQEYAVRVQHNENECYDVVHTASLLFDPCDANVSGEPDHDNDGIADNCDEDDDNDGILDKNDISTLDCDCINWTSPTSGTYMNNGQTTTVTVLGVPTGAQLVTQANFECSEFLDLEGANSNGGAFQQSGTTLSFNYSNDVINPIFMINSLGSINRFSGTLTFTDQNGNPINIKNILPNSTNNGSYSFLNNQVTGTEFNGSVVLMPGSYAQVNILYVTATGQQDGVYYTMSNCVEGDLDGDGLPERLDTDSDGDGCFDVVESGGTDANNDGILDGTGFDNSGLVTGGTGGYDGRNGSEYKASQLTITSSPTDQTNDLGQSATFSVMAQGDAATSYNNGSPIYATSGNANNEISYQWYLGNPNASGTPLSDGSLYSNTNTSTLTINTVTQNLAFNEYYVVVSHNNNVCLEEVRSAILYTTEICNDGIDNDGDGLTDCEDCEDCSTSSNCTDTDNDGIGNFCDDDDDNDGLLDINECLNTNFFWSNAPTVSGNTATGTINGVNYLYTSSHPILTTPSLVHHGLFPSSFNMPNITSIRNIEVTSNTLTFATPVENPILVFTSIGRPGTAVSVNFSDPITILFSLNLTSNSPISITGNEGVTIVRIDGIHRSISFDYTAAENYCNFFFGANLITYCDTDGDGILDKEDPDSDGDGCPDVIESGGVDANSDGYLDGTGFSSDGLVQNHVGGYNGLTGQEYNALGITEGTLNNLTVTSGNSASFHIGTTAQSATGYNNGTPVYGSPGNKNSGLSYQWYLGNPNAGGTPIVNGGVYSGATTATLNISSITGLNNQEYAVRVQHNENECYDVIHTASLLFDPCDANVSGEPDHDNDGITDNCDEDNDNDGISNSNEGCISPSAATVLKLFVLPTPSTLNNSATFISPNEVRLTHQSQSNASGFLMSNVRLSFAQSFDFSFEAFLGSNPGGADGLAALFHNDPRGNNATGSIGNGLGIAGIQNGIGLAMDTHTSAGGSGNALQMVKTDNYSHITNGISLGHHLENGNWHEINVNWADSTGILSFTVDSIYTVSKTFTDIVNDYFGGATEVFWGYGSATGGGTNTQSIRFDPQEIINFFSYTIAPDLDRDGIADCLDLDSDGDGCYDVVESGGTDSNNDGKLDGTGINSNGLVAGGTGGYNGITDDEYVAHQLSITTSPTNQVGEIGQSATFSVVAQGDAATSYNNGSPIYATSGNANNGISYQWYLGNPNASGTPLSDGSLYSNTNTSTLTINTVTQNLAFNEYCVLVTHNNNNCIEEIRCATLYTTEICNDGIDNDGDGLTDCEDPDCSAANSGELDTDSDGVIDYCDLDDDNDGILDVNEDCAPVSVDFSNLQNLTPGSNNQSFTKDINGNNLTSVLTINAPSPANGTPSNYSIFNGGVDEAIRFSFLNGHSAGDAFSTQVSFTNPERIYISADNAVSQSLLTTLDNFTFTPLGNVSPDFQWLIISSAHANITTLGNAIQIEGISVSTAGPFAEFVIVPNEAILGFSVVYKSTLTSNGANNGVFNFSYCDSDTDDDAIPNSLDPDSDGDGCFDVVESGGVDTNNDGILDGTAIDSDGLVTGGTGGYNGVNGSEIVASQIIITSTPSDQTKDEGESTSIAVTAQSDMATHYITGIPFYTIPNNNAANTTYQWYLGNPNTTGTLITDGGIYSGATTSTLDISDVTGLNGKQYCVVVSDGSNVCDKTTNCMILTVLSDEICDDGIDNDGDGLIDCADTDCVPSVVDVVPTPLSCPLGANNGKIVITATGPGTLTYSITNEPNYQASNTFSNLGQGLYTIRVQSSTGCTSTYDATIIQLNTPDCPEICDDGIDNDGDGDVDCDDSDCGIGNINSINNN